MINAQHQSWSIAQAWSAILVVLCSAWAFVVDFEYDQLARIAKEKGSEMDIAMKPLEELIQQLSPRLRVQARTYVEFLLTKRTRPRQGRLRQDWAGALKAQNYTSVELQHLALQWRDE
jgi:hypothetical protein